MKRLAWLVVAFALLVTGIESIKVLVAWWQAGRPPPGMAEILALAALLLVGVAWWRHSVFACGRGACLAPPRAQEGEAADGHKPR
jgi:hypothetical protein